MAKSFKDSLTEASTIASPAASTMSLRSAVTESFVMTASDEPDAGFEQVYKNEYEWIGDYSDDKFFVVDDLKNVKANDKHPNITQEDNSQVIPFELPRYYDGIDLSEMLFNIHFVTSQGYEGLRTPINVMRSTDKIRFYWVLDSDCTTNTGLLAFEIIATGYVNYEVKDRYGNVIEQKTKSYIWKTKPNRNSLNVIESLSGNGQGVEPAEGWTVYLQQISEKVAEAEQASAQARAAASAAQTALEDVDGKINNAANEISEQVMDNINGKLSVYYTGEQVDTLLTPIKANIQSNTDAVNQINIDLATANANIEAAKTAATSDLNAYKNINDPKVQANTDAIAAIPDSYYDKITVDDLLTKVQVDLSDYYTKGEVESLLSEVEVDLSGYYTKTETDSMFGLKADKSSVTSISEKIVELEESINNANTDPTVRYETTYNSENGEFVLWSITDEEDGTETKSEVSKHTIVGGGGGASTSTTITITRITSSPLTITKNDKAIIEYEFTSVDSSGEDTGEGTAVWKLGNSVLKTTMALQGKNTVDLTEYLSVGSNKLTLSITDSAGSISVKTWTVQIVDLYLDSSFNDRYTYPLGPIAFDYTPYGSIAKKVYFILDGEELGVVNTSASGLPLSYEIPAQEHGAHLLEVYATAEVNNATIETNHIFKDILWYDETSDIPVIGTIYQDITVKQYDSQNIVFTVYDPKTSTPTVTITIDDEIVSTVTMESPTDTYQFKTANIGDHTLTITCGETIKTISIHVEELDINVTPITANLAFDFNPVGRSNSSVDRLWSSGDVAMTVSENFDWVNGGYQYDENGDQYFCVKARTRATINYKLFGDEARKNGKEFKVIFKTNNVAKADSTFLSCESGGIGLKMNIHDAYVSSNGGSLFIPYAEQDIIEFDFNIKEYDFSDASNNASNAIPHVMSYEDGTPLRPMIYESNHSFTQTSPVDITIGCDDCDVYIYRMKAYKKSLSNANILSNFIADARSADDMIDRYNRNQIYNENQALTPESLAAACPDLKIIKLDCPYFTNDKNNFIKANFECIHVGGDPVLDNWKVTNGYHSGQGTTSNEYGQAGRNMDLLFCFDGQYKNKKITYEEDYITTLTMGDGTTIYNDGTGKIELTRNSVPTNYLNVKVNIASSENMNNAKLQKRYNEYLPYKTPAQKRNPKVKNSMEFVNCVIFLKETDPDISTHREFADNEWHYYALGNIGDSKKTDYTRVCDANDHNEFVVEIMDNTYPNATFPGDAESLELLETVSFDDKNDKYTYEFRYEHADISDDEQAANIQKWCDFYKFVVNSTEEEFAANLKNWFIVDSALYFYLFTERYTMTDNRAKNTFWHWFKNYITAEEAIAMGDEAQYYVIDDEAAAINNGYRFEMWDYDNDTALGINNSGELTMPYGKEDIDYRIDGDPSSGYIYNAAESTFFRKIRNGMYDELAELYRRLESTNCWSAESLINEFDVAQSQFPEIVWLTDYERKYERTYLEGTPRFMNSMMNGRKKYHRRQFERDQEKYIATKYYGTSITEDQIMFRCNTPVEAVVAPDYTLHLTPYSDMYLSVMFGATARTQIRAKAGQQYDIECPFTTMDDTAVLIYCASRIQSTGDLSPCYIHDNDFSKASKLKVLIMSNDTPGYSNAFLTNLNLGNNALLEKLDIRNAPNLTQTVNLSGCPNLEEFYAENSGITGVIFANGGRVKTAHLPEITSIVAKNLVYLEDLSIAGLNNMQMITIENTPYINTYNYVVNSPNLTNLRLIGIDWGADEGIADTSILDRLLLLGGIDTSGYNTPLSVITGSYYTPIVREKLLADYNAAWSDLLISYGSLINQYIATFTNYDNSVLDIQYVDVGHAAVDPVTRADNPIATPTKPSTVSHDYTYIGWGSNLSPMYSNQTYMATYSQKLREYTITHVSMGTILQTKKAPYGTYVDYEGETPTYTLGQQASQYHLFERWDKSGYVNGDKTINAVFDSCIYVDGYFNNKDLSKMRLVEIYMLTELSRLPSPPVNLDDIVQTTDSFTFTMGHDFDYDDIAGEVIINEPMVFNGTNYYDTNISLMDIDKDFVLAVDYEFASGNTSDSTLMQCFADSGKHGFKLYYNNTPVVVWADSREHRTTTGLTREMLILRHVAGETGLHVYTSNLDGSSSVPMYVELAREKATITDSTLVFGCKKIKNGSNFDYEGFAKGTIYWAKLWHKDLGDASCRELASYIHEEIIAEMHGTKLYWLSDYESTRSSMTFLSRHVIHNKQAISSGNNAGGWASSPLNSWLNSRFYDGVPVQVKQLIKKVDVSSSVGSQSNTISTSQCHIYIPSAYEIAPGSANSVPYINEVTKFMSYFTENARRIRTDHTGKAVTYWTRSPYISSNSYFYRIEENGNLSAFLTPTTLQCFIIEFSI